MEVIAVVKELVLPRNVTSEDQPMEANGIPYVCICNTCVHVNRA